MRLRNGARKLVGVGHEHRDLLPGEGVEDLDSLGDFSSFDLFRLGLRHGPEKRVDVRGLLVVGGGLNAGAMLRHHNQVVGWSGFFGDGETEYLFF